MIKNRLDNYLIPPKTGHLTHIDPILYIKCLTRCNVINQKFKNEKTKLSV